jgi:hypothetical protein
MSLLQSLQKHHEACEDLYRVMLDLNRSLKTGAQTPEDILLARQRAALAQLDSTLSEIRNRTTGSAPLETRAALERCQRSIMKTLLLDRENEQLLLKNSMVRAPQQVAPKPSANLLARAYARH